MKSVNNPLPSKEELRKRFTYDKNLGVLCWKYDESQSEEWNEKYVGKRLKTISIRGYLIAPHNPDGEGKKMQLHRLIYGWHYDFNEVLNLVTHIDGNKKNNRIENLQLTPRGQMSVDTTGLPKEVETNRYGQYRCVFNANGVELTSDWSASLPTVEKALNELKVIFGSA